jgi:hypothetical protein
MLKSKVELKNLIEDKSVCLVGGSSAIIGSNLGKEIDSYDIVARVNYHWPFPKGLINKIENPTIHNGNRTDIFFHSGVLSTGGGPEEISKFNDLKLIVTYKHKMLDQRLLDFCKKNEINFTLKFPSTEVPFPTTGFNAIVDIIKCNTKKLYICGFDFYNMSKFNHWLHNHENEFKYIQNVIAKDNRIFFADYFLKNLPELKRTLKNRKIKFL